MTGAGPLEQIDVVVLAGGLGTRVSHLLGDVPKLLAPIGGRPFLDFLIEWLAGFGARRIVLCLGHLAAPVLDHLNTRPQDDVTITPLVEPSPLGTAGAMRLALPHVTSDPVFVLNGDTFLEADLDRFVAGHLGAKADISLLCAEVPSVARFGRVEVAGDRLMSFVEKDPAADRPGLISGGMYLFSRSALAALAGSKGASLETDFLQIQPAGSIRAEVAWGRFIDIGTPQSLAEAPLLVPDMARGALR